MYIPDNGAICLLLGTIVVQVAARCYDPSPAFPLPKHNAYQGSELLKRDFQLVENELEKLISDSKFDLSSYSIEITSSEGTLWENHHTSKVKDGKRPGAVEVNGNSVYRMASVTKCFTTLGLLQQHIAGNLSLDDTVDMYLSDLSGSIPWKDITLKTIASQLSGIPRDSWGNEISYGIDNPTDLGLPPLQESKPPCFEFVGGDRPCEQEDLFAYLAKQVPLYPPKQKSTYSNTNFDLLGLVLENVTGIGYADYIESSILQPLGMAMSSFTKSNDSFAVLPKLPTGDNYWDTEEGVDRPTGGLYSSSSDMSKFLRYVLKHYNGLTPTLNWFHPASYSTTISSFYGTPWEIFRTNSILPSTSRPVTFVTKSGSVPGYLSYIILLPEYDLGVTILTTATSALLKESIREIVTVPLVRAAEHIAQADLATRYTGTYQAQHLNSTLVISHSATKSLYVESFISNSTDIFAAWNPFFEDSLEGTRIQLVPTLLFKDEKQQQGEIWRGLFVPEKRNESLVWDDFCVTDDDPIQFGGKPLFEVVMWHADDGSGRVEDVELSGFRVKLKPDHNASQQGDGVQESRETIQEGGANESGTQHIFNGA
ncbi:putative FLP FmtA-like protein, betalactamase [Mollisia scopiformis]|uniref:Putative FLP FmtA-like protein, betalactamase n=1 Tax=Mollisia scopiformis TaxID=149040 RepID=A0A194X420_MOLSC|nr:putative FLP FmtA-like protein, betalactamase [Mollisia scopiformis]KUJ14938.1 putative FLP FmtA-like protein, betalactamase [Mollisia scopiformis]